MGNLRPHGQLRADRQAVAVRAIAEHGGGWHYYTFTNPATGSPAAKASYILPVDWNGTPAFIGSGVCRRDFHGARDREEVNAAGLSGEPSNAKQREFVRCAALQRYSPSDRQSRAPSLDCPADHSLRHSDSRRCRLLCRTASAAQRPVVRPARVGLFCSRCMRRGSLRS